MSEKPTTQPKPPTLAQLRKLAKRKGYQDIEIGVGGLSVHHPFISPPDISIFPANLEAHRLMFKALSALPDAKGGKR